MINPDQRTAESMARIGANEKPFMDWLDVNLASLQTGVVMQADETQLRILQGRAQLLIELQKLIKDAPSMFRKA